MYSIEDSLENVIIKNYAYPKYRQNLISDIQTKFKYFINNTKTFFIEDYVENEWRDSFELYYSRASYKCSNTVKRIHLVADSVNNLEEISQENYLGYFNIRPIPPHNIAISRIRLKCMKEAFELSNNNEYYCLNIKTNVNFPHLKLTYNSFPLYSQDAMVTVCAHADILMITKYMYKKFNFSNYQLKEVVNNINLSNGRHGRRIPSEGLTISQMADTLRIKNYNPVVVMLNEGKYLNTTAVEIIDSFIESALPIIIAFKNHVIVVIGHMHDAKTGAKNYIIADDSSYHIKKSFKKTASHVTIVAEEELQKQLKEKSSISWLIAPSFDRQYLQYNYLKKIVETTKSKLENDLKELATKTKNIEIVKNLKLKTRIILVEASKLKQFLYNVGDATYQDLEFPHYVWYIEFYFKEITLERLQHYMLINASSHKLDIYYSVLNNINNESVRFANKSMRVKKQLSLLTKI